MMGALVGVRRLAAVIALSLGIGGMAANAKPTIDTSFDLDRPKVLRGDAGPIYVLLNLDALEIDRTDEGDRPILNLGLVLDRSGSMQDKGKIEFLKRAAKMSVDQMTGKDYLSVVEYDDQINVLWPSNKVDSPSVLKKLIDNLEPRGMTNLTGGMMRGVDEVYMRLEDLPEDFESINRVLLLSDGLANEGVTDPDQIRERVRSARQKGVRITTLGLGRDYDEDLMQEIAEYGGGHYYFIEHPDQMSRIFQEELETLFKTTARDASLKVDRSSRTKSVELVSFDEDLTGEGSTTSLGDFYSGETRTLILRFKPEEGAFRRKGKTNLGTIEFSYYDIEADKDRTVSFDVKVDVVTNQVAVDSAMNKDVVVETALIESERRHREAVKLYEKGEHEAADAEMKALAEEVGTQYGMLQDDRLKQKQEALHVERDDMVAALAAPEAQAGYLKKSKQRLYQTKSGKRSLYTLQIGDKGIEVERIQQALLDAGFYQGEVDGIFSDGVKASVEAFQTDRQLTADGIAGPATMSALGLY